VDTIYAFHWLQNNGKGAFIPQKFKSLKVLSGCYLEDDRILLLGMTDGYIYKLDTSTTQDNGVDVPGFIRTKRVALKASNTTKRLMQSVFTYEGLATGAMTWEAVTNGGVNSASLYASTLNSSWDLIYYATGYIAYANGLLYSQTLDTIVSRKLVWHYDLQYLITVTSGSLKINRLEALINIWGRRQV